MNITALMAELALQIGIILFMVRVFGRLAKRVRIPPVLGELLAGVVIGPYALGGIPLPGFPEGVFALGGGAAEAAVAEAAAAGPSIAVSPELYAFATIASIILLFASGLETDLKLFLRYSVAGGVIGLGGAAVSFFAGAFTGMAVLGLPLMNPAILFLGVLSTATSVGITARILSEQKKMDSPEGVTILAAAVFDDVLGIIMLAVVLGVVAIISESGGDNTGGALGLQVLGIAGRAFGIWLGFTLLGLIFSRKIAGFLKLFKQPYDFSILALGLALLLAGFFEKQGLALIIGAYITGLSLSNSDIAPVIQERLKGLYEFFVPIFFAVMGMMVNVREIIDPGVLLLGALYTLTAIAAKIIGCGGPALFLGFNLRGAGRIGMGMVPRGEVALIIAGIGMASGILDNHSFGAIILMTFITTLAAPPLLNIALNLPGPGTRRPAREDGPVSASWDFSAGEIAGLVMGRLLEGLRQEGFYVQTMSFDEGLSQARKDDVSLSISRGDRSITITTGETDMPFVKTELYEVLVELSDVMAKLKASSDPRSFKKELADLEGRAQENLLSLIEPGCIKLRLKGTSKEEIITELVDILDEQGKLIDRPMVLGDILEREKTMSTGMQHGIALPHGKTSGVEDICAAVGIKREGVDFDSLDGEKTRLFILVASPRNIAGPHVQFLAAIGSVLNDEDVREQVIRADSPEEAAVLLQKRDS